MSSTSVPKVVPAQLSFLAIYNPALSSSDEDVHQQIVFYHSKSAKSKSKSKTRGKAARQEQDKDHQQSIENNDEKLLQVGLAQGMVDFARSFSNGEPVESIDTERSRIVLIELEEGFWILAVGIVSLSIDLTRLPVIANTSKSGSTKTDTSTQEYEYSAREVSPPELLKQQLRSAYSIFTLHHTSFQRVFARQGRESFERVLQKYWTQFAKRWDVLLHGNPAVEIYNGLKLASGGELGMGVGEEEWGSPERDVLEGYVKSTDGLIDVVVSRFGEPASSATEATSKAPYDSAEPQPWLGNGKFPGPADGVVFSGTGALSRQSLRDVSRWVESIYTNGEQTYGVTLNPTTGRERTKRRVTKPTAASPSTPEPPKELTAPPPGIPPPIVRAAEASLENAAKAVDSAGSTPAETDQSLPSLGDVEAWKKYLTLPYSSFFGRKQEPAEMPAESTGKGEEPELEQEPKDPVSEATLQTQQENKGYFLVGLQGDMDDDDDESPRIPLRFLHVELAEDIPQTPNTDGDTPAFEKELSFTPQRNLSRLRALVYVHRPFIYIFFLKHSAQSLTFSTFYRTIHSFFSPLNASLSKSTSPERVAERISSAAHPYTTNPEPNAQPIYDVVYDPKTYTVHASLPNIPEPGTLVSEGISSGGVVIPLGWSRVEALHVHSHIMTAITDTRRDYGKIEQTCKTSRGWWVAWMRLPPSGVTAPTTNEEAASIEFNSEDLREAFLIRRARDSATITAGSGNGGKTSGSRFASGMWGLGGPSTDEKMGGKAAGWGPKGLAEGIGVDTRRHVSEILSLCR
ncbi:hypothetical protein BU24DRAFT_351182 [Aaosphaeria arxii CBS 175.79]|uniref:CCZ1/INTU/HSP4 first Longin domain-containing protein n=1 Tax=Aaosphaeria arxii CBS 175.79 TaxID=1450172 RepID=A0A6A5XLG9_9PLEO|nr:uncharacterized protein BU24DRAFT_351182 [Aaosphaeria arxii CBS 175.79]KAF2013699.1 hypothetical protein BU24DRAFT_351182 [Aaosphaeria arxii CBS 175.79]